MRSIIAIAIASLVASAAAIPLHDGKHKDWEEKANWNKEDYHDKHLGKDCKKAHPMPEGLNSFPFHFTSKFFAKATPNAIVNNSQIAVAGQPGAVGYYSFGVNAYTELICYNITLVGVDGDYQSPASTATHIHQAPIGRAGPPRISFPNPTGEGSVRTSFGCLQGPFTTGLNGTDGVDTGTGFSLYKLEADPSGFFADVHTSAYPAGAIRGQIGQVWWSDWQ